MPKAKSLRCLLALVLALGTGTLTAAATDTRAGYACTFPVGGAWAFEKGAFVAKPAEGISFDLADIDKDAQTARLVRKEGSATLKVVEALGAYHFIEVAMEGFLNVTTIYEREGAELPAVHSRHVAVLGEPVVSQYRGTCRPK
jgi:hypothetical protein